MNGPNQALWWKDMEFPTGETLCWQIGPFSVWITRSDSEWRVAHEYSSHDEDRPVEWRVDFGRCQPADAAVLSRYIFGRTSPRLSLKPVLADRPVVTKPHTPFYIPSGIDATIFVSTPLWVRIEVNDPPVFLQELPIVRPSDTWFGSSTLEGEICYATRTSARLRLEEVPRRPHRAITPVMIRNRASSNLFLERLSIPVPFLALYGDAQGLLWTEPLTLIRETETEMAEVRLAEDPPAHAETPVRLMEPRQKPETGMLVRAFSSIFK